MSIHFDPAEGRFALLTRETAYHMQLGPLGHLLHLYYGRRTEGSFARLYPPRDCGFSPNPEGLTEGRGWSLDTQPQEYSGSNCGDFRLRSIELETGRGVRGADLRYARHRIEGGKYAIPGLPAAFDGEGEAETLSVTLADPAAGLEVELRYGVFPQRDVICRSARIVNTGDGPLCLEKAASACLDLPFGDWDLLAFHGRHAMERNVERQRLRHGVQTLYSRRGASSHQMNPFAILCARGADEDHGDCLGAMLVWSGGFRMDVELDQAGSVRLVAGIQSEGFRWTLEPGEAFETPELLLAFSHAGLTRLSHLFHRFLLRDLIHDRALSGPRPVLLNSWEAAYMDFDTASLLRIARGAKDLGADLFVLDDGWFGHRKDDHSSLGDWTVNEAKLPGGLAPLIEGVRALGMDFGLWVEPEMVSPDSELYRAHPDWAFTVPGRAPTLGRDQLVLDLGRREVRDWVFETLAGLLRSHPIAYLKWDANRQLTDVYASDLPPERQGEAAHRYMLGLYEVLGRLNDAFPELLIEGCAGGGGRFDAGMLYYCPQIWCSDNTDALARLRIQYGTSFGYPPAAMGAHLSAIPNHQTGRSAPLGTRAAVAMAGTFGFELDPARLTVAERAEVRDWTARFRRYDRLLREGDYYRITAPGDERGFTAWETVSGDRTEALLTVVLTDPEANPRPLWLRIKGIDPARRYRLEERVFFGCARAPAADEVREFTGGELLYGGMTLPQLFGDCPGALLHFRAL